MSAPPVPPVQWYARPEILWPLAATAALLLLALALKLRRLPSRRRARHFPSLDAIQLEELMLGNPPRIVDLRPPEAFRGPHGHIRGAINVPHADLQANLKTLLREPDRPLVLVDEQDAPAYRAAAFLKGQGAGWVFVLQGGYRAWRMEHLPTYGGVDPKHLV